MENIDIKDLKKRLLDNLKFDESVLSKDGGSIYYTLSDVKNSKWLSTLQQKFLNNEKLDACKNCWHEEEAGIQSKRLRENLYWGDNFTPGIKALDLKLGNICNSKCSNNIG